MARIVEGFHSFTYTTMRFSAIGMYHAFTFPVKAGPRFIDPGVMEGRVELVG